jgi:Spy/CpxP family protein refolding chaperone
MMHHVWLLGAAPAAVVLIFATTGMAAEGSHKAAGSEGKGKPEHQRMRAHGQFSFSPLDFKEQLQLSKEQQEKLEPIQAEYKKSTKDKEAKMHDAFEHLGTLLEQPSPEPDKLKQKVKEISDVREDIMMYRIETLLKLRSVLTDEQQKKYRSLLTDNLERFGEQMERYR